MKKENKNERSTESVKMTPSQRGLKRIHQGLRNPGHKAMPMQQIKPRLVGKVKKKYRGNFMWVNEVGGNVRFVPSGKGRWNASWVDPKKKYGSVFSASLSSITEVRRFRQLEAMGIFSEVRKDGNKTIWHRPGVKVRKQSKH